MLHILSIVVSLLQEISGYSSIYPFLLRIARRDDDNMEKLLTQGHAEGHKKHGRQNKSLRIPLA